jgi:hypothetical protein
MAKAKTLQQQLLEAYEARQPKLTWGELIRLADLSCSEDSVARKLRGKQKMFSFEVEALATALRAEVRAGKAA